MKALLFALVIFISPTLCAATGTTPEDLYNFVQNANCNDLLKIHSTNLKELSEGLAELTADTLRRFPPQEFQVIGIGRSPSLLVAALQNEAEDYAFNLPLSSFRPWIRVGLKIHNFDFQSSVKDLSQENLHTLYSHFAKFIPFSNKRLVLVDYSSSGATLISVYHYLHQFLQSLGDTRKIKVFTLYSEKYRQRVIPELMTKLNSLGYFAQENALTSFVIKGPLAEVLTSQKGEFVISEFGPYFINEPHEVGARADNYLKLRELLRANK